MQIIMENIRKALNSPTVQIEVKKTFKPETKTFNGVAKVSMNCIVACRGQEFYATIPETKIPIAKVGAKLIGVRKLFNGKAYYEWSPADDLPKPEDLPAGVELGDSTKISPAGRGQSLSLAAWFSIYQVCGGKLKFGEWLKTVTDLADEAVIPQSKFVQNL